MTGIVMFLAFFFLYQTYIQEIIYEERLNQMEEVTRQMFQNLEDVIDARWVRVTEECNYLEDASVQTTEELCAYMKKKYDLSVYAEQRITLLAVDSEGGYYTESGNRGLFRELDYFEDSPEKISFVFSSLTDDQSEMVFLKRLSEPIHLQNDDKETVIRYLGIAQNMEQLNPYFNCDVYKRNNSVYVLDNNGFKMFNSNRVELIKGHNVFSVLKNMKYLHNSSFDKTEAELEEKGYSYSNAVLDGTEYFYGLKRMENAEWTLIFLVPAKYVATNTLKLVNFVMIFIVIFTVIVAVCVILVISFVMHRNQQEAIRVERENNAKLETVNTELRQAKLAAEEAFHVAQEANRSKSSFLANMSHDIRTPMNAIVGITSLIEHECDDGEKVKEYAKKIELSSQHLLGIINDVLDMSKIENGKTTLKYADFSISELLQEMNTVFHPQANEKHQTFVITGEDIQHDWVKGDRVHLMQIFTNLLSNAVKYTQAGGIIQFIVEECQTNSSVYAKFRFLVKDNGMGISPDFKDKIFDAFTREESSLTNKIQGTGLGMAITRNLVEVMGGTIDVESVKGQGSCFDVLLDLKIAEQRVTAPTQKIQEDMQDISVLKGMRFLCAEDNELNAEILTELLKIEGAGCTICENGEEILNAFEQSAPGDYDMILMDVQMPVMNGYEATKAIRRSLHELAKTIPIIAMTANAFSEDIQHSLAAGMNAHISKPVEMRILEKTVRDIKSGRGGARNTGW
nr:hybrid sensor histidine kinase/response regulator [uncultured Blautia sp.]